MAHACHAALRTGVQFERATGLRTPTVMLSFFMAGPDLVRWELMTVEGGYCLTVRHATGVIVEYFRSVSAALLREQELESLLQAARGFAPPAPATTAAPGR